MRLTQGTAVTVREVGKAYFQQFVNDFMSIDSLSKAELLALVLLPDGKLKAVHFQDITVAEDPRENIIREFIEHAAENKVAPTELVNEALRVVG